MHRSDFYWSVLIGFGTLLATAGCRSQHADSHVQISPGPRTFSGEVDPPASRLAGARASREPKTGRVAASSAAKRASDPDIVLTGAAASDRAAAGTAMTAAGEPLTESERQALKNAFRDLSPEIRALAEQRISALQAQSAPSTTQLAAATAVSAAKPAQSATEPAPANATAANATAAKASTTTGEASDAATAAAKPADQTDAAKPAGEPTAETAVAKSGPAGPEPADKEPADKEPADKEPAGKDPIDIRQAVAEGSAETEGNVKTASASSDRSAADAATDPAAPLASMSDEQLFDELIARYQERWQAESQSEPNMGDLITLRALTTLSGDPDAAIIPVEGWTPSEQEFLNYQMLTLWQLVDPKAHPVRQRRWAMALPELRQATNHLAASTGNLDVRSMSFCTEVESYGRIKPFPADRFTAGQQVILYSELENFVAERLSDGYETHLRGTYEIFDATGRRVADQVLPEDRQTCNNYRRDYFIAYQLYLPDRLTPGNYRFELTMEDMKGKKYGQGSIPLEIIE